MDLADSWLSRPHEPADTATVTVAPPRPASPDFEDLLALAATGDSDAFASLVTPLMPQLSGYLRAQAGEDGDDLFGDVLLAVFSHLARFAGTESQFRSWVFTVAHHRAVDHRRRLRRRPTSPISDAAALASRSDTEREALERLGLRWDLRRVLEDLPPSQRQVLLLRVVADLSVDEVATVIGKRPGTVRVLQHRALESLRRRIRRRDPEEV